MELRDKVAVVTGGGSGIGEALAERFLAEGARHVVVADLLGDRATAVAERLGERASGVQLDVSDEAAIVALVEQTLERHGPIDLFVSNAGYGLRGGLEVSNEAIEQMWQVHTMSHIYAARAVLPSMIARGEGYLLNTASAAGLLTNLGAAPYSVTKHAAVGLAEWLAITHGDQGIKVSCLCPQGVRTNMLLAGADETAGAVVLAQGAIEPEDVAEAVVEGLREESFLILPHPEVLTHFQRKAGDYDRWLGGMRKLQRRITAALS
jgi:NAD(P)-dependent dehydrogenase (short-subunit alcohol dehydrogenase family)